MPVAFPPDRVTGLLLIDTALPGDWETFHDAAAHLVLPSIVLAAATLGLITRTTRAAMLEALSQDYVRVARAKGLRERADRRRPCLPNALIPVVTLGGLAYANLLTGAVMTETVFSWPGLGRYTFRSAVTLDFPAIMGITLIVAAIYRSGQLPGRHVLRPARSARGEEMTRHRAARAIALAARPRWLRRYGLAAFGAAIILAWVLAAIFAPWLTPLSTRTSSMWRSACGRRRPRTGSAPTRWGATCSTRVIYGARISLTVGIVVVLVGALFGTLLGAVAAYARGWAEEGADAADRPGASASRRSSWRWRSPPRSASARPTPSSPCWWCGGRNSPGWRAAW